MAGSPIRHESAVQGSAVEVQTYQPPWKALSEFALQSDLDQPAFQQLVRLSPTGATSGLRGRWDLATKPRWEWGAFHGLRGWGQR